jgi:hypothetical protein
MPAVVRHAERGNTIARGQGTGVQTEWRTLVGPVFACTAAGHRGGDPPTTTTALTAIRKQKIAHDSAVTREPPPTPLPSAVAVVAPTARRWPATVFPSRGVAEMKNGPGGRTWVTSGETSVTLGDL